jgi:hypothetical protein
MPIRFGLRTMFVVMTVVAVGLGVRYGWRPDWINQRRAYLERYAERVNQLSRYTMRVRGQIARSPDATYGDKLALWFFGEPLQREISVYYILANGPLVDPGATNRVDETLLAARLFPEATVRAIPVMWSPGVPADLPAIPPIMGASATR